jgi:hypothetical protein
MWSSKELSTLVQIHASFSVGEPQQDTIGRTLQILDKSEFSVIAEMLNL